VATLLDVSKIRTYDWKCDKNGRLERELR